MSISDLRPHHLPLIQHMHRVAAHVIASIRKADVSRNGGEGVRVGGKDGGETFRIGYHAVPSLKLLHLHVISTDFDSPCLKVMCVCVHIYTHTHTHTHTHIKRERIERTL